MNASRRLYLRPLPLLLVLLVALVATVTPAPPAAAARAIYVDDSGSNTNNPGTKAKPYRTIGWAVKEAGPGDTIYVRGGTYRGGVANAPASGTPSAPITLTNYPGEYVLIEGILRLTGADWWIVDNIDVTADPTGSSGSLVAFYGGSNWTLRNSRVWGGNGTSQLLVMDHNGSPAENFKISNNCIHDAATGGKLGTEHNIYLFPGLNGAGGVIERNILFDAPNGANIKIGGPGDGRGPANVTVRFNTMATSASNMIIYRDADANLVERNLLTNHVGGDQTYNGAVVSILTKGRTNLFRDNAWHDHPNGYRDHGSVGDAFKITGHREVSTGFDSISSCGGFHPTDATATLFGRYAKNEPLPADLAPSFTDTKNSVFKNDIDWLAAEGITAGCNPPTNDKFCPGDDVTRGAMAAFLTRALDLPASSKDRFIDDNTSVFEQDIQAMAAAGVTAGCNPPTNDRYCPTDGVTRGAMAAFLVRALDLPASSKDSFTDDDTSVFEQDIQAMAAAGITSGCNPPQNDRFCPNDVVTRGQMAAFLRRAPLD